MTDLLLRIVSFAVLVLLFHQLFWSVGGSPRHNSFGKITMLVGAMIVILVTIRGSAQEVFSPLYTLHLMLGAPFFIALFTTGLLGWKSQTDKRFVANHRMMGRCTLLILIPTLIVGIASRMSHL